MAVAALSYALMGAFVKASSLRLPFEFALVSRNVIGLLPLAIWYLVTGRRPHAVRPRLLFTRGVLGFLAMLLFFHAIDGLPLAAATVLNYTSPVFVVLLSAVASRDARILRFLPLVVLAFAGVAILAGVNAAGTGLSVAEGLLSAVFAALAYMTVRELSATESSDTIVWYFTCWASAFSLTVMCVAFWTGAVELDSGVVGAAFSEPSEVINLCAVGVFGTFGQLAMTAAYARASAPIIAPISYLNPLVSYGLGWLVFDDPVTAAALCGGE
jgi:drug/metabolite transporter (DMT)-like permease